MFNRTLFSKRTTSTVQPPIPRNPEPHPSRKTRNGSTRVLSPRGVRRTRTKIIVQFRTGRRSRGIPRHSYSGVVFLITGQRLPRNWNESNCAFAGALLSPVGRGDTSREAHTRAPSNFPSRESAQVQGAIGPRGFHRAFQLIRHCLAAARERSRLRAHASRAMEILGKPGRQSAER